MSQSKIWLQTVADVPGVTLFAIDFDQPCETRLEFCCSADERCILLLDGNRIGTVPEYGDQERWFLRYFQVPIKKGKHRLTARVFAYGTEAAKTRAQISIRPGFFFGSTSHPNLNTATRNWRVCPVEGLKFSDPNPAWGTGAKPVIDGRLFPWQAWHGEGSIDDWPQAQYFEDSRNLVESSLPPQKYAHRQAPLLRHADTSDSGSRVYAAKAVQVPNPCIGEPLTVPAGTKLRLIFDFEDYICAWLRLAFAGNGGAITLRWAETLFDQYDWHPDFGGAMEKGNRNDIEGKVFHGVGDDIIPFGNNIFDSLWWNPGRYLEVCISTNLTPVTLHSLEFYDAGYPLQQDFSVSLSNPDWLRNLQLCYRTLEMCSHDTWYDCPYYEQLMYIGDAMMENLLTLTVTRDRRLPKHAVTLLQRSRLFNPDGMLHSRWPSWDVQVIPSFIMYNILIIYDLAHYTDCPELIADLLSEAREQLRKLAHFAGDDGLLRLPGWNFIDWVWPHGVPEGLTPGTPNAIENWLFVLALEYAAELEEYVGSQTDKAEWLLLSQKTKSAIDAAFWDQKKRFYATNQEKTIFSEHPQIVALLTHSLQQDQRQQIQRILQEDCNLTKPDSSCFSHLFFKAATRNGIMEEFYRRFSLWNKFSEEGLKTIPEQFSKPRSDCHAWSAHPLYHYFAGILGIRPAAFGFKAVEISPNPGSLECLSGCLPHPDGNICLKLTRCANSWLCEYSIPAGLPASLTWQGTRNILQSNSDRLSLPL